MTDFIDFELSVKDNNKNEEKDDKVSDSDFDSLKSLIDDNDEMTMTMKMTKHFIESLKV